MTGARRGSPTLLGVAIKIVLLNAIVEGLVMFVLLPLLPELPPLEEGLLDVGTLSAVGGALLWWLVIRPYYLVAERERGRADAEHQALLRTKSLLEASHRFDDFLSKAETLPPVVSAALETMAGMVAGARAALWTRGDAWTPAARWPEASAAAAVPALAGENDGGAAVVSRDREVGVPLEWPGGRAWIELSGDRPLLVDEAGRQKLAMIAERVFRFAQRKAMEAALQEAVARANSATRAKSEFLSNMSHELRTPMTAILGFTDLLMDPRQSEAERIDALQTIRRNGRHLLQLVNDILDLSKIEANKLEVEPFLCDVRPVFAEVLSTMGVKAAEKELKLDLVYATRMPSALTTDPTRFKQILFNLVSNALKFTAYGGVRVAVRWLSGEAVLEVDVTDTGPGMDEATLGKLFQVFTQADASTTRKHGGTGLGLAISRRLARMLGGDITVTSAPGRGSTFTMRVAAGAVSEAPVPARQTSPPPPRERVALSGRILLAEDGPDNRALVTVILRRAGATVDSAENGREAVDVALAALARGEPYLAILMDMQMPVLDGYDAVARLRSKGYRLPVIAFTAHAMADDRRKCLAAGCDDHVTKPIVHDELLGTLAHWMHLARIDGGAAPHIAAAPAPPAGAGAPAPPIPAPAGPAPSCPAPAPLAPAASPSSLAGPSEWLGVDEFEDDPDLAALVDTFVAGLPQRIAELRARAAAGDLRGVQMLAHQLKGAAGSYGFPAITDAAGALEDVARSGSAEFLPHLAALEQLEAGIAAGRAEPPS